MRFIDLISNPRRYEPTRAPYHWIASTIILVSVPLSFLTTAPGMEAYVLIVLSRFLLLSISLAAITFLVLFSSYLLASLLGSRASFTDHLGFFAHANAWFMILSLLTLPLPYRFLILPLHALLIHTSATRLHGPYASTLIMLLYAAFFLVALL